MSVVDEVSAANENYAAGFAKGGLPMPPGRKFAVVTCMDARLDPARFLGLEEGDTHVVRNAGGLVNDDDPLPRHLPPPARDEGGDRHRAHRLRHAHVHERRPARKAGTEVGKH